MFSALALSLVFAALMVDGAPTAHAQAGSASDLIAAVNAYRAENGLAPYSVDGGLMSEAQEQSEYQASVGSCTHDRADGSSPAAHGISAENVACGPNLSVNGAIYGQWTDALHSATMLGPVTGSVGAGVAQSGVNVYYTLDVKRLSGDFTYRAPKQSPSATLRPGQSTPTPNPQFKAAGPVITSTTKPDGSVVHIIRLGETLIQIAQAYGVTLNDIYAANSLVNPTSPAYYAGQVLVIRLPYTATPTPSQTLTPRPPTRTHIPTRTATRVLSPTASATPTTPTPTPLIVLQLPSVTEGPNRQTIGWVILLISAIGIALVLIRGFVKKR
jgi:LysM repeat protein